MRCEMKFFEPKNEKEENQHTSIEIEKKTKSGEEREKKMKHNDVWFEEEQFVAIKIFSISLIKW